jgi:uncharacterized protein YbjQ (UPF0145 family)
MPLFHRESPEERQRKERAQQEAALAADLDARSRDALARGGIPVRAQERIAAIRGASGSVPLFSSDFSVDELALVRQTGYEPLALVAGSSVFHVGWNRWTFTGELDAQTRALFDAAQLAINRMRLEAEGMGAVGVVGVRLEIVRPSWGEHLVEIKLLGTALRVPNGSGRPFLSGLSAQEFVTLLHTGSRPAGFVFGNTAYYIYTNVMDSYQNMSWYNQEVQKYSWGLRDAQRYAFGRMHANAQQLGASGIVGVHIEHRLERIEREEDNSGVEREFDDYIIEFVAWGTAIVEAPAVPQYPTPTIAFDLEDRARTRRVTAATAEAVITQTRELSNE